MTADELVGNNKRERLRAEVDAMGLGSIMNPGFETILPTDTINIALKKMKEFDIHEVPVTIDGGRLMGVISYGTLLKRRNLPIDTKVDTVMFMPEKVDLRTTITEVAEILINHGCRELPVSKDGYVVGTVSRSGMLRVVQAIKELQRIQAGDIMSQDVKAVRLDTSVKDAVQLMSMMEVRVLPVVDDKEKIIGVVGIKDIASFNWREKDRQTVGEVVGEKDPIEVKVGSVAVEPAMVASPSMNLGEVARTMLERGISTLPVVEDGAILGIITKYDLVELVASLRKRDVMYVQISGLSEEDSFSHNMMLSEIGGSMKKISSITTPMMFNLHVAAYKEEGLRYKYSLHGRLTTEERLFTASSVDWDLVRATSSLMKVFERRIIESKEERVAQRKKANRNLF